MEKIRNLDKWIKKNGDENNTSFFSFLHQLFTYLQSDNKKV